MENSGKEVHCELHNLDLSMVVAVVRLKRAVESIERMIKTLQRWEIYALWDSSREIITTRIRESIDDVIDVKLCGAIVVPSCGGSQDTVKLFDVSADSGGSRIYSFTPTLSFVVNSMKWNHTSKPFPISRVFEVSWMVWSHLLWCP